MGWVLGLEGGEGEGEGGEGRGIWKGRVLIEKSLEMGMEEGMGQRMRNGGPCWGGIDCRGYLLVIKRE